MICLLGSKEIWFRYPTIDGVGITGNLNLKPLLEAFEMQGGTETPEQYFVKDVTGDFANLPKMKNWCCVAKVGGVITGLTDIEYFSWQDYYNVAIITGDISNLVNLFSFVALTGSEAVTGSTSLLVNMEQFRANALMTKPATVNHMPKLSVFVPLWVLTEAEVNQYLADIWANREVVRTHYKNTVADGVGFRSIALAAQPTSAAPTGQGVTDKTNLNATISPAVPGDGDAWTVTTN